MPTKPSRCRASAAAAANGDPVSAYASSGKTNMLTELPSSDTVCPIHSTVKSWLRASWRYPDISAP